MKIEIANGTFKALTDVSASTIIEVKDDDNNVIDKFAFGIGEPTLSDDKFIGQVCNGKIVYIAKCDTDDKDIKDKLKKLYGKSLARAAKFEEQGCQQIADAKAKEAAEKATIDSLFA